MGVVNLTDRYFGGRIVPSLVVEPLKSGLASALICVVAARS